MRVTVARVWEGGDVTAFCSDEMVGAEMEIEHFIHVLFYEAQINNMEIEHKLMSAIPQVLSKMKRETSKVVR